MNQHANTWITLTRILSTTCLWVLLGHAAIGQAFAQDGVALYRSLLAEAQAGNAEVQTTLGLMRLHGDKVNRDLKIARIWFGKAASKNHTPAQYYLGQLLLLDVFDANKADLNKQLAEGLFWLRQAARSQHHSSQLLYAKTILESQLETPLGHSKTEAWEHLRACSEVYLKCTEYALNKLDSVEVANESWPINSNLNEEKKRLLYTLANSDNADNANARYRLSKFESEDRIFWLRRSAQLGHPQGSYELAKLVLNNETTLQAEDPAVLALLNSAAQQGLVESMHLLGSLLYEGTRFPVNKALGLQWLKLAAEQGYKPAQATH